MVARPIANARALRDLAQRSWASEAILPDTCPDRRSGWSFRRSGRSSRRSVKPSADPTLVRTRHLPLLPARGSRRDQDHAVRSNAEDQSPAGTAQPAHRCPSRDAWLHPAEGTQHSEARPVPTRQNSQFCTSATSRAVIVRSVPNGGSTRRGAAVTLEQRAAVSVRSRAGVPSGRASGPCSGAPGREARACGPGREPAGTLCTRIDNAPVSARQHSRPIVEP